MKKTIKLAVVAALALGTTSAFATNGSNLIGMNAKSLGMGGTSIANSIGAGNAVGNAALITNVKNNEVSFGGTIFMPDVESTNNIGAGNGTRTSDADMNVIPQVSLASKITDEFYAGIGMWGTAGMGVDYRKGNTMATGGQQLQMVTALQLMQFGVPLAYKMDDLSLSFTPVLQYGSLDINYNHATAGNKGTGRADDLQFGFNLGLAYQMDDLTLGAQYKSQIDMDYDTVMPNTIDAFSATGAYTNKELSTPAEIGVGVSYDIGEHTIAIDYKRIQWSDAEGYKDFDWDDQDVVAVGYEYRANGWAARAGFNYASAPFENETRATPNSAGLTGAVANTFNLIGFPGMVETHYTVGGTYDVSEMTSVDLAFVYAAEEEKTNFGNAFGQTVSVKHSQTSIALAVNMAF